MRSGRHASRPSTVMSSRRRGVHVARVSTQCCSRAASPSRARISSPFGHVAVVSAHRGRRRVVDERAAEAPPRRPTRRTRSAAPRRASPCRCRGPAAALRQPRSGLDRPAHGELRGEDVLHAERVRRRRTRRTATTSRHARATRDGPMRAAAHPARRSSGLGAGPRHVERHRSRIVDAFGRQVRRARRGRRRRGSGARDAASGCAAPRTARWSRPSPMVPPDRLGMRSDFAVSTGCVGSAA